MYRFVSTDKYDPQQPNPDILDTGTLSVARFLDDGYLEWLPITFGEGPLNEENGFFSQADCLIDLRIVGRLLERHQWIERKMLNQTSDYRKNLYQLHQQRHKRVGRKTSYKSSQS